MTITRVVAVTVLALATATASASSAQASTTRRMVDQINSARRAHGLPPLAASQRINRSSASWARFLMRKDWLGHASLRSARVKGEVIELHSSGQPRVAGTVRAWLRSPGHRAILLSARFHHVGVGKSTGQFQGMRCTIWVGRFI